MNVKLEMITMSSIDEQSNHIRPKIITRYVAQLSLCSLFKAISNTRKKS